jgi:signal transduction histidine kinase
MPASTWSTQQLAEFVSAIAVTDSDESAAIVAVEQAAEALDAEVSAIVFNGTLVATVGYPEGAAPVAEIESLRPGASDAVMTVPGSGMCPALATALGDPVGGTLVVARSSGALGAQEAALLRGMARVTSMRLRTLRLLADERTARQELAVSRARIVATADATRRRIERDLHDGTQQRLLTLALELRALKDIISPQQLDLLAKLSGVEDGLREVLDELREIARGVHPAILSQGGIGPALKALARRSTVPVELEIAAVDRLPAPVEVAAYYVASEALANATKHAGASVVRVRLEVREQSLRLVVQDDGVGGADSSKGSGIVGLIDRAEALGGSITVASPAGHGTTIRVELPTQQSADVVTG